MVVEHPGYAVQIYAEANCPPLQKLLFEVRIFVQNENTLRYFHQIPRYLLVTDQQGLHQFFYKFKVDILVQITPITLNNVVEHKRHHSYELFDAVPA